MKIYISADIEGVTGITHWDETDKRHSDYSEFREQMTAEVAAACRGALAAGAQEIWVKDAHGSGRNLYADRLPEQVHLIRGWSGHPFAMVQEIDASFSAALFIGYHARAGSDGNPLAHTMSGDGAEMWLNGTAISEFALHAFAAASKGVPVALVSGDRALCDEVARRNAAIHTVAVSEGVGNSSVSIHPARAVAAIEAAAAGALRSDLAACKLPMPAEWTLEIDYHQPHRAYRAGFYPGAERVNARRVRVRFTDYFEVMRALLFIS